MPMTPIRAVAVLAMMASLSRCSQSQRAVAPTFKVEATSLELHPSFRELRTVRLESKIGPLTFLLDTGGGTTLVRPEVAARAGCAPYGRDVGHRMSGERVEFKRCDGWEFGAGEWRALVDPTGVFDVNALLPKELPRLDGVLALDAFRGRVI